MRAKCVLVAAVLLLVSVGAASAVEYTKTEGPLSGKITVPDTIAPNTDFVMTLSGERADGSAYMWAVYRGGTPTADGTRWKITGGTQVGSNWGFSDPWSGSVTQNLAAGTYTYYYLFGENRAHRSYGTYIKFDVTVGVQATGVDVDIKPGSCPNPLNVGSKGTVSVAVLGSATFDVATIDAATVKLAGVSALRWSTQDVATPVSARTSPCQCTTAGADGHSDLVFKFDKTALIAAVGAVNDGDEVTLTLEGKLTQAGSIEGADCMVIRKKKPKKGKS